MMRPDLGEYLYRNKKVLDLLAGKTFNFYCPMQVCRADISQPICLATAWT